MPLLPRNLAAIALVSLSLTATPAHPQTSMQAQPLRVMSFNIRLPVESDGPNQWLHRKALIADMVRAQDADLIGTQELHKVQADDLVKRLPQYKWFGRDRRGGHDDEHMGVFYRSDRLRLVDSGDFWLSDTPEVPGSITWGHPLPRMVTWALFERLSDRRRFHFYNTHFPYRDEDDDARERGARLIASRVSKLPADIPLIVLGDFNTTPASRAHAALTKDLRDAWDAAPKRSGPPATFHEFTGKPDHRIDWILYRGLQPLSVRTVTDNEGGRYPSDHFPVVAEFEFPAPR